MKQKVAKSSNKIVNIATLLTEADSNYPSSSRGSVKSLFAVPIKTKVNKWEV